VLSFTRPLLDLHIRRRLATNPHLLTMQSTEVIQLVGGNDRSVAGVIVRVCGREDEPVEIKIPADLVVDTTGRASRAPSWLVRLGYPAPEEITVNAHLGYASRLYQIPEGFDADWTCAFAQSAPPKSKRGGIMFAVEGNRWLVTLVGGGRDYPPKEEETFLEFARSLRTPIIYDAIRTAKPVSPIKVHRGTENRLRRFDKLPIQPRNFVALGDSVCAFNPVYGQGMTIAAMGAMTLDRCLQEWKPTDGNFARGFQKELSKVTAAPWMLATSEDYRYRETEGGHASLRTRFMHRYMNQVLKLSTRHASVRHVLLQAFGMLVPPTALFRPNIALRVLRHAVTAPFRRKRHPRPRVEKGRGLRQGSRLKDAA
jgi:flavin-dependent dehydrogenase